METHLSLKRVVTKVKDLPDFKNDFLFILEKEKPVPVSDPIAWHTWMSKPENRVVKNTPIRPDISIVTLFIGMNPVGQKHPKLFQTFIVVNGLTKLADAWYTFQQAAWEHENAVEMAGKGHFNLSPSDEFVIYEKEG